MRRFGSLLVMDAEAGLGEPDLAASQDALEQSVDRAVETPVRGFRVAPRHRASRRWKVIPLSER